MKSDISANFWIKGLASCIKKLSGYVVMFLASFLFAFNTIKRPEAKIDISKLDENQISQEENNDLKNQISELRDEIDILNIELNKYRSQQLRNDEVKKNSSKTINSPVKLKSKKEAELIVPKAKQASVEEKTKPTLNVNDKKIDEKTVQPEKIEPKPQPQPGTGKALEENNNTIEENKKEIEKAKTSQETKPSEKNSTETTIE
ncbi:MAG: hypothetical protein LBJ09_01240 [Clostridiales bacterium]|nr:hypothetical protein [Clostridiales bacterium]